MTPVKGFVGPPALLVAWTGYGRAKVLPDWSLLVFMMAAVCSRSSHLVKSLLLMSRPAVFNLARNLAFVPASQPVQPYQLEQLQEMLNETKNLLVLTGAGISTESGIPDYRSEEVGLYARSESRPIQYMEFLKYPERRKRYWARNYIGWPKFSSFLPNIAHKTLAGWEKENRLCWLITQNVDALHTKAGTRDLTELHGCSHRVVCLNCRTISDRHELQQRILQLNPLFEVESVPVAPDGDVLLDDEQIRDFRVPECVKCGGTLKPDVTFFGDNVPKTIVHFLYRKVDICDAVLVAGSSLYVYSGYRFINRAYQQNKPIIIINIGETRADNLATLKIPAKLGDILPKLEMNRL
ncbi:NAD-dependent protein lipoamidase sirtuin-4, mitochondrial-like [Ptychodera flava]|uniref:NAD-dependent protein lipoamidase sirtuin-4, mitochondrial-like n=1 Tax=Ptychodera flava TaxID=63121 RepID=UPI00396A8BDC